MSKSVICTLRDIKADYFLKPMIFPSRGEALRSFIELVNSREKNSPITMSPGDFVLFELASLDDETMVVTPYPNFISLGNGLDFIRELPSSPLASAVSPEAVLKPDTIFDKK